MEKKQQSAICKQWSQQWRLVKFIIKISNSPKGSFYKTPKDKNFKRERFNSDGNTNNQIERIGLYRQSMNSNYNSNPNFFNDRIYSEEVKVDPTKVKYSLKRKINCNFQLNINTQFGKAQEFWKI